MNPLSHSGIPLPMTIGAHSPRGGTRPTTGSIVPICRPGSPTRRLSHFRGNRLMGAYETLSQVGQCFVKAGSWAVGRSKWNRRLSMNLVAADVRRLTFDYVRMSEPQDS